MATQKASDPFLTFLNGHPELDSLKNQQHAVPARRPRVSTRDLIISWMVLPPAALGPLAFIYYLVNTNAGRW